MQTSYTVVVRKEHCEGREYTSIDDCPLCAAIRNQIPEFPLKSVSGSFVRDKVNNLYFFATSEDGWNVSVILDLLNGVIDNRIVTFSMHADDISNLKPELGPKRKIEYEVEIIKCTIDENIHMDAQMAINPAKDFIEETYN